MALGRLAGAADVGWGVVFVRVCVGMGLPVGEKGLSWLPRSPSRASIWTDCCAELSVVLSGPPSSAPAPFLHVLQIWSIYVCFQWLVHVTSP